MLAWSHSESRTRCVAVHFSDGWTCEEICSHLFNQIVKGQLRVPNDCGFPLHRALGLTADLLLRV